MPKPVDQKLSDRQIKDKDDLLVSAQREIVPVIKQVRDLANSLALIERQKELTVGPPGSGADYITDGVADNVEIQAALDASSLSSLAAKSVSILPGSYRISSQINIHDGVSLFGAGIGRTVLGVALDFDDSLHDSVISISPATNPDPVSVPLFESTIEGLTYVKLPTGTDMSRYVNNDYVMLHDDQAWNDTASTSRRRGELIKINKIGADVSGSNGTIVSSASNGLTVFSVPTNGTFRQDMVLKTVIIGGADVATTNNNGNFTIISVTDDGTSFTYFNNAGGAGPDANNGSLTYYGPSIAFFGMCRDRYSIGSNASVSTIPWMENITIAGLEMYQVAPSGQRTPAAGEGAVPMIGVHFARNCTLKDLTLRDTDSPGITIQSSLNVQVTDCQIRNLFDFSVTKDFGYGVLTGDASEDVLISNVIVNGCRHGIDSGRWKFINKARDGAALPDSYGVPRGVNVSGCLVSHFTDAAYSTHETAHNWTYTGCTASNGDSFGFFMRGTGTRVLNCTVQNASGGIFMGNGSSSGPSFLAAGSAVMGCSIRYMKNIDTAAADLDNQGLTGTRGGNGGGNGIALMRADHMHVENNTIEFCSRAGVRIRTRTKNCIIRNNVISDVNQDQSGASNAVAIAFETPKSGDGDISGSSGSTCTFTKTGGDTFNKGQVGGLINLTGFPTGTNNVEATITAYLSSTSLTLTWPSGGAPTDETGGSYEEEGASYNIVSKNLISARSVAPTGSPPDYERDIRGSMRYGIRIEGLLSKENVVTDNECIGMNQNILVGTGVPGTIVRNNTGSPDSFYLPTFSPGTGVAITDSDYLIDNAQLAGGVCDYTSYDPDTRLALITATTGTFASTHVGKNIALGGFTNSGNDGRYTIQEYVSPTTARIHNINASPEVGGTWNVTLRGLDNYCVSFQTNDTRIYVRSGSTTHVPVIADFSETSEILHEFGDDLGLRPAGINSIFNDLNTQTGVNQRARVFFDPDVYPSNLVRGKTRNVYLSFVMSSSGVNTPEVRLYNGTDFESVNGTTQSHTGTSPARYELGPLSVGSTAGFIKEAETMYVFQGRHNVGVPTDAAIVHQARFIVRYE